ncbi:MAG: PIN domain-containing protein [Armatimonadota bacterium]|nr:PIN domain-containing protein [Armatimonadota bacterium]
MIFVDTAAFLAIENRRDAHHEKALGFRAAALEAGETFVTSDYVLDESYTLIRLRAGHTIAVQFGEDIRASRLLRIEYLTEEIIEAAWRIFKAFADKEFSFTDCTSFALMEHLRLDRAFTFDEHFRQYGRFVVQP